MEIKVLPNFIDEAASVPARVVGDTLANLWELGIGSHVRLFSQKQHLRQQHNYEDYKNRLESKTHRIPEENLTEPKLHIVGPAIEASKYYIESEELREMFANLIAASIDNRKTTRTHPSFVEIIKQLSPLDAQNLSKFKEVTQLPICKYNLFLKNDIGTSTINSNVFLENDVQMDIDLNASSIENISRLGLTEINYGSFLTDEGDYEKFRNTPLYKTLDKRYNKSDFIDDNLVDYFDIKKGVISVTPFGKDFIEICLI